MSENSSTTKNPSGTQNTSTPTQGSPKAAPATGTNTPSENDTRKSVPDVARTTAEHAKDADRNVPSDKDAVKHAPDAARTTAEHRKDADHNVTSDKDATKHAPDATRTTAHEGTKPAASTTHNK